MAKQKRYINREISWLSFNARVLEEAQDKTVPLLERLKFLGIFSNNLDEFYRVRIATLKRVMQLGVKAKSTLHGKPEELLDEIQRHVLHHNKILEATYRGILQELTKHHVHIVNEKKLTREQGIFVREFFIEQVRPALVPIMLNQIAKFPYLKDKSIYLAIKLSTKLKPKNTQYALVEVPTDQVNRFVQIPAANPNKYIILLDDIIRFNLPELFSTFEFDTFEAYTIKLTRDAELDMDTDMAQSFIEKLSKSIKNRQKGNPVRFVYDQDIAPDLLQFITSRMRLHKVDNLIPGGRYHNFKDFISFPNLGLKHLLYKSVKPLQHPALVHGKSMFEVLRRQDVLLHYPYQSFGHFLDLLREAAIDPQVKSIRITLYRVARSSNVINILINAARNGKQVSAVVELRARFDEEANIHWAQELAEEGIQVIYGVPVLKVHSKLVLIERSEGNTKQYYANISTGNYNERTAALYCDDALFTADKRITSEVRSVFEFFEKTYIVKNYKHLILSPHKTRSKIAKLIEAEIANARLGKTSGITWKLNSLVDEQMIDLLYKASEAGVPIRLIVRGMCALVPGVRGQSENIQVISIIDAFLEHSRILKFENGGQPKYYIGSADMMTRNLDMRIEVTCPVYDPHLQQELQAILDIQWNDTVKARAQNRELPARHASRHPVRAQFALYDYLKVLSQSSART